MTPLTPYHGGLCRPLDPYERTEVVHTHSFPGLGIEISLRPLYLGKDTALLYSWIKKEYARSAWKQHIPFDEIIETLVHTARSDFAQVYTGMDNDKPLCEVEIAHASQDEELGMYGFIRPGDYVLRLMPSNARWGEQLAVLETCVEFFLLQPEVERLLAIAHDDARENSVIGRAGFVQLSSISTSYRVDNLYEYSLLTPPSRS